MSYATREHLAILSLMEWQNLLSALKNPIERYGIDAVLEALKYLQARGH